MVAPSQSEGWWRNGAEVAPARRPGTRADRARGAPRGRSGRGTPPQPAAGRAGRPGAGAARADGGPGPGAHRPGDREVPGQHLMVRRVFVHIGLPKTATTYLQTILWGNRAEVRRHGLLLPGKERRDHLWASRVVREEPERSRRPDREHRAWDRIRSDLAAAEGDG